MLLTLPGCSTFFSYPVLSALNSYEALAKVRFVANVSLDEFEF